MAKDFETPVLSIDDAISEYAKWREKHTRDENTAARDFLSQAMGVSFEEIENRIEQKEHSRYEMAKAIYDIKPTTAVLSSILALKGSNLKLNKEELESFIRMAEQIEHLWENGSDARFTLCDYLSGILFQAQKPASYYCHFWKNIAENLNQAINENNKTALNDTFRKLTEYAEEERTFYE